jgi:PTS system N-acetylgalactosamine-specific IIA component
VPLTSDQQIPPAVRAIVAAHGTLAAGIVSAVEQITGRGGALRAMSNTGLCLDDIQETLARTLDETDLPAGSCTMAVRRLLRARPDVTLVTGMNLTLLLDFVMQDAGDAVAAARTALERGRASMVAHGA